jgi:hypothetical protein
MTYQATIQGTAKAFRCTSAGTRNWKLDGNQSAADLFVDPQADEQEAGAGAKN